MSAINYNYNYENIGTTSGTSGSSTITESPELVSCKKAVLDTLAISNGTFYHATDTDAFYYDFNGTRRLLDIYGSADLEELETQLQAAVASLTAHTGNNNIHVTTSDKTNWNNKQDKLDNADVLSGITSAKIAAWDVASGEVAGLDMDQTSGDFVKYVKQVDGKVSAEGSSFVTSISNASGNVAPTEGAVKNYVDNNFVKSVNGAKGDVTVRTFSLIDDDRINTGGTVKEFCDDLYNVLNPEAGTAYLAEVYFTAKGVDDEGYDAFNAYNNMGMPETLGNGELIIYVPVEGVYELEMHSTNGFDKDYSISGKWMTMYDSGSILSPWKGFMTASFEGTTSDGYQYVAHNDADGISKYYLENVYKPQAFTDITKSINAVLYASDSDVDVDSDFVDGITTLELCQAIKSCNPKVGSAYMTKARLTDYPESFRGTSGMNTGELLIYIPSNGLYVIDMYTTNNFTDAGNGDKIDSGKYTTIFDAYYNSVGRLVSTWQATLTCPQQESAVDGKYKYVATEDWHSVSKYHLDQKLSEKLNVLPVVDEDGNPGNGYPYWIPYDTVITPDESKLNVTLKCLTLDNNLTKMSFDKELTGATTTTAGVMTAADKKALNNKTDKLVESSLGKAYIFNESDGGGAKFENSNGTYSFIGVNGDGSAIAAQIYAKDNSTNVGSRIDITKDKIYYTVGSDSVSVRDVDSNEIAVKGDIPTIGAFPTSDSEIEGSDSVTPGYATVDDVIAYVQAYFEKKKDEIESANNIAYISGYPTDGTAIDITSFNAFTLNETGNTEIEFMTSAEIATYDPSNDEDTEPIKVVANIPSGYSISSWLVWNSLSSQYNNLAYEVNSRHATTTINGKTFNSYTRSGDEAIDSTRKYKITITKN